MLTVNNPETLYIKFIPSTSSGLLPRKFVLKDAIKNKVYFERFLNGKTPRIKFNIPDSGKYLSPNSFEIEKRIPIEIPKLSLTLPKPERDRIRDINIVNNPDLYNTPARIFTELPVAKIEKGKLFNTYTDPTKIFFLLHEVGHQMYGITNEDIKKAQIKDANELHSGKKWLKEKTIQSEMYCDLFALTHFLQMGYNMSTAMYALTNVLKRTPENEKRVLFLYNKIMK